ncbi:GTP cyclohydrolase I FolE [Thermodesulfobium sp. 4217-1]|uniref:GTP cyclohydrolase I FolE n=1 Tax=Thermodesulfobium sp. 4217-1 TaxID=3120013 RepID=UPI0032216302
MDHEKIKKAVYDILVAVGENPEREGLKETPDRIARMYEEIFSGINEDPMSVLNVEYHENTDEMVLIRDIPFYSVCEHHLIPFIGKAHVAYLPKDGRVVGLSKIARVVDILSKKPQLQERLTSDIANTIMKGLDPLGVAAVVEAEHLCMSMRGVRKPGHNTVTSALRGAFKASSSTRSEVLSLIFGRII